MIHLQSRRRPRLLTTSSSKPAFPAPLGSGRRALRLARRRAPQRLRRLRPEAAAVLPDKAAAVLAACLGPAAADQPGSVEGYTIAG